jgi:electron transport complex protein RnfG
MSMPLLFRDRDGIPYQTLLLGGFTAAAAVLLVSGHLLTRAPIAEREAEELLASLSEVIPPSLHDNDLLASTVELSVDGRTVIVYRALDGLDVTAVAFEVVGQGYAGPIRVLLGVAADGRVQGARVLAHAETPGLGDKIELARADWILGFDGRSLSDPPPARWAVEKDGGVFDQFSGATITPRAVVAAIKRGLQTFASHREALTASAVIQSGPVE